MRYLLAEAVYWFSELLIFLMIARALFSWIRPNPYSILGQINDVCIKLTEPIDSPCRRLLSRVNTGVLDFSVLLAFFLVQLIANILIQILV